MMHTSEFAATGNAVKRLNDQYESAKDDMARSVANLSAAARVLRQTVDHWDIEVRNPPMYLVKQAD